MPTGRLLVWELDGRLGTSDPRGAAGFLDRRLLGELRESSSALFGRKATKAATSPLTEAASQFQLTMPLTPVPITRNEMSSTGVQG